MCSCACIPNGLPVIIDDKIAISLKYESAVVSAAGMAAGPTVPDSVMGSVIRHKVAVLLEYERNNVRSFFTDKERVR